MRKKFKKERGITLVALVVTIIILLILAGISISQLTGSELFKNAKLAEEQSKVGAQKENEILVSYGNEMNKYISSSDREELSVEKIPFSWNSNIPTSNRSC